MKFTLTLLSTLVSLVATSVVTADPKDSASCRIASETQVTKEAERICSEVYSIAEIVANNFGGNYETTHIKNSDAAEALIQVGQKIENLTLVQKNTFYAIKYETYLIGESILCFKKIEATKILGDYLHRNSFCAVIKHKQASIDRNALKMRAQNIWSQ